ncbi:hypothetical protein J7I84_19035 [Arthrobacter sp. ISL-85]|uniref:hypothetical protein n=1 Tax=Arthrobacter sp. ISL-85 TaxID=2819115 RepID=UPI001BE5A1C1|nr:hypothetical protein [Arthrobacter sp. ISL-85]MBT2568552.1 hypothetical protein [Arthrobacter sp. ISL-85]
MGFWDELKQGLRDQAVGAVKYGASTSPGHNRQAMLAAREERLAREEAARRRMADVALSQSDLTSVARAAYREAQKQKGRDVQFEQGGVKVLVQNGYSRKFDKYTTDVIVIDPARRGEHLHVVYDENGAEIHNKWTKNH